MTIGQSNRERMGDKVNNNLYQNSAVFQSSPKFQGYATQHSDNLTDVRKWKNLQEEGLEIIGINRDKNALRSLMIANSQPIIGAIWTVASVTDAAVNTQEIEGIQQNLHYRFRIKKSQQIINGLYVFYCISAF
jgi:hypothetical protein